MSFVLIILVAVISLTIVSGVYVFIIGFVRKKDVSWLIEDEMRKTPFGKHYNHVIKADRWLKEHRAHGVAIESSDGLRLHGLWVPAEQAQGTVLLVHGYRSTYLVGFGPAFDYYHKMGLNLLIPDQRAHGESQGKYITFGVKESDDMLCWLRYHNTQFGEFPVVLCGLSMGASTVIYMLGKAIPPNVRGVIADCGYTSPADILATIFCRVTRLPAIPALFVTDILARFLAGVSIWKYDSRKVLRECKFPILMIHGKSDTFVPCKMTQDAYEACTGPKDILLVENAEHGVSFLVDQERYIAQVEKFLGVTLGFAL